MRESLEYRFDFSCANRLEWKGPKTIEDSLLPAHSVQYFIGDDPVSRDFCNVIDPLLADALEISVKAHIVDRLALRQAFAAGGRMPHCRHLIVTIPVREPDFWKDERVSSKLREILEFLTEDRWEFRFASAGAGARAVQRHLFGPFFPAYADISLFSGGLDSFSGCAKVFGEHPERHFVCVSASPNNIQKGLQRRQFNYLCKTLETLGTHICFQYGVKGASELMQEPSRRTRAFVFLLLGGAVALSLEAARLNVYENGVGAINLPFDLSQVGIDNTRAMHPRTLQEIADLLSLIGGRRFEIRNRSLFITKTEMCCHSAVAAVREAIAETFSCDRLTHAGEHCGYCTSCLLRRLAVHSAGLDRYDHRKYLNDCFRPDWRPKKYQLRGLSAMTWQATRLKACLSENHPWTALRREFPELQTVVSDLSHLFPSEFMRSQLLSLYQSHVHDWFRLPAVERLGLAIAA